MSELSEAQRRVLERMQEGWALCYGHGFNSRAWLQQNGCGRGGPTERVVLSTFVSLRQKGIVASLGRDYPTECYGITDAGGAALAQREGR